MPGTPLKQVLRSALVQTGALPYVDTFRHHLNQWRAGTTEAVATPDQTRPEGAPQVSLTHLEATVAEIRSQLHLMHTRLFELTRALQRFQPADVTVTSAGRPVLGASSNLLMLPRPELMRRVVGVDAPDFLVSGQESLENLLALLARVDKRLEDFESILDFGCGCARTTRFFLYYGARNPPTGVDVDADQIEYCQQVLSQVGRFERIPEYTPTQLGSGAFDLVYSISTFTHFREDMQHAWLTELQRVTRPGAILVLTFHNEHSEANIPEELMPEYREKGFVFVQGLARSAHNPEYYHAAFHTHDYVRRVWSQYFDVLDIVPRCINNNQDAVILRRRG